MLILWFVTVQRKSPSEKRIGWLAVISTIITGAAAFIWTNLDLQAGVFVLPAWPWTYAAQLGLRAGILYGILFGLFLLIFAINRYGRGSAGGWWLPPLMTFFAIEYFIYDDQFTIIALVILPMMGCVRDGGMELGASGIAWGEGGIPSRHEIRKAK